MILEKSQNSIGIDPKSTDLSFMDKSKKEDHSANAFFIFKTLKNQN
jgi:hypothetical protein